MKVIYSLGLLLFAFAGCGDSMTAQQARQSVATPVEKRTDVPVNEIAALQVDFKNRINNYLEIRKQAAKDVPSFKETKDPAKIKDAETALAARIQTVRASAQPGDIFTAAIQTTFRKLLAPELKGEKGKDVKDIIKDDAPKTVPLKVNSKYPDKAALPTVPSNLLLSLPTLPKELEYRIIGKDLILRDTDADLIVDFIPNAIK